MFTCLDVIEKQKKQTKKKNSKKTEKKGFSKIEKELYREVDQINKAYQKQVVLEETKKETMFLPTVTPETVPPTASRVLEVKGRFGNNTENRVTEWEKIEVKKVFKTYDKDKSGFLSVDELKKLMHDLKQDKMDMGKVPDLTDEQIETLFDNWDKDNNGKISWQEFRDGWNSWKWRLLDQHEMGKTNYKYVWRLMF